MAQACQWVDFKPPLLPSSGHTLASEVTLLLACIDMVKEEEARLFSIDNHGAHKLGAMESNLQASGSLSNQCQTLWHYILQELEPRHIAF
jgi:hypothetical protein